MNILGNKEHLRNLLQYGDLMNTVNGGTAHTSFTIENHTDEIIIKISNKTVPEDAFKFFVQQNQLIMHVLHMEKSSSDEPQLAFPIFSRILILPYYIDISRIEAFYIDGEFRIKLPFNQNIPKTPKALDVKKPGMD